MLKKILIIFVVGIAVLAAITIAVTWQATPPKVVSVQTSPTATVSTIPTAQKEITIISTPQAATISINGQNIGQTPLQYTFELGKSYELKAIKTGYVPLVLTFTPNETTLRLQLVPNTLSSSPVVTLPPSPTISPSTSSPIRNSEFGSQNSPTAIPFPVAPNLRVLTQNTQSFVYTPQPTSSNSPTPISSSSSSLNPTTSPTPNSEPRIPNSPSDSQKVAYTALIAEYSGIHDAPPDDTVQEGTSEETGVVVSNQWLYISQPLVLAGFPIRFINEGTVQCDLKAQSTQGELAIGKLVRNDSLLFTAQVGTNETMRFWCQERPSISVNINIFS